MKIRILTSCTGATFSFQEGDVVDVDNAVAADLIQAGYAEKVKIKSG